MEKKQKLEKLLKSRFSRFLDANETDDGVHVNHFSDRNVYFTLCYQKGEVYISHDEFCVAIAGEKYYCSKHDNSVESIFKAIVDAYYNN